MLKVKDVNRLKVFGFKLDTDLYVKKFKEGEIMIDAENGTIIIRADDNYLNQIPDDLFELFAANLVERV